MRILYAILVLMLPAAAAAQGEDPRVSVRQTTSGTYAVTAGFTVNVPAAVARDVLTDYAALVRIIPNIKQSRIVERTPGGAVVEQQAVSNFMFFSKSVHLLLHIDEDGDQIRFRDACGKSFSLYEGSWTIVPHGQGVELRYELTARPTFDVPLFVIRKAMSSDARDMSERLRAEMLIRHKA